MSEGFCQLADNRHHLPHRRMAEVGAVLSGAYKRRGVLSRGAGCPKWTAALACLFVGIALCFIGCGLTKQNLPAIALFRDWIHPQTKLDGMEVVRRKDVGPIEVSPQNNDPLVVESFFNKVGANNKWPELSAGIRWNDGVWAFDFVPWLAKIHVIRSVGAVEVLDRYPTEGSFGPGATKIPEIRTDTIGNNVASLVFYSTDNATIRSHDRAQLSAAIDLGIVGDFPLLVDEKISGDIGNNQKSREYGNRTGPLNQISFKLIWGLLWIGAGILLTFRSIWHGIFSDSPYAALHCIVGLLAAGSGLIYGLSNVF